MASTITLAQVFNEIKAQHPKLIVLNSAAGQNNTIALGVANTVEAEAKAAPWNFKWNVKSAPAFITNGLQQDYSTNITDLAWLEDAFMVDINNPAVPQNILWPQVKNYHNITSDQSDPESICWIYNSQARYGTWIANQLYTNPLGQLNGAPLQPWLQIVDPNGNFQVLKTFGTTGAMPPSWPAAKATAGTNTTDGTVVWTVVDPDGVAFRTDYLPPQNGTVWQMNPIYQKKPTVFTALSQLVGWPDEMVFAFKQGCIAYLYSGNNNPQFSTEAINPRYKQEYEKFLDVLDRLLRGAADRELNEQGMMPQDSLLDTPSGTWWLN